MRWICKDDIEECLTEQWRKSAQTAIEKVNAAKNVGIVKLKKYALTCQWIIFGQKIKLKGKRSI